MVAQSIDRERTIESARISLRENPPEGFEWINKLRPVHQRQFALELAHALSKYFITKDADAREEVFALLESWEATAELDAAPEVAAQIMSARGNKQYIDWSP